MIIINEEETGLGKSFLKKIRLKDVSLKNAVKVTKFAAPIAAGFIPVGGGVASKLLSSKGGKLVNRVAKSKAVRKGVALSKTKLGRKVVSAVQNQPRAEIEPVSAITAAPTALVTPRVGQKVMANQNDVSVFNAKKTAGGSYFNSGTKPFIGSSFDYGEHIGVFVGSKLGGQYLINRDGVYYFVNASAVKGY